MWAQHVIWAWVCTEVKPPWEVWYIALQRKVFGQATRLNAKVEVEPLSKLTLAWKVLHRVLMRLSTQSIFSIGFITTSAICCARHINTCSTYTYLLSLPFHPTWMLGRETVEWFLLAAHILLSPSKLGILRTRILWFWNVQAVRGISTCLSSSGWMESFTLAESSCPHRKPENVTLTSSQGGGEGQRRSWEWQCLVDCWGHIPLGDYCSWLGGKTLLGRFSLTYSEVSSW